MADADGVRRIALSLAGRRRDRERRLRLPRAAARASCGPIPAPVPGRRRVIRTDIAVLYVGDEAEKQALLHGEPELVLHHSWLRRLAAGDAAPGRRRRTLGCGSWSPTRGGCVPATPDGSAVRTGRVGGSADGGRDSDGPQAADPEPRPPSAGPAVRRRPHTPRTRHRWLVGSHQPTRRRRSRRVLSPPSARTQSPGGSSASWRGPPYRAIHRVDPTVGLLTRVRPGETARVRPCAYPGGWHERAARPPSTGREMFPARPDPG